MLKPFLSIILISLCLSGTLSKESRFRSTVTVEVAKSDFKLFEPVDILIKFKNNSELSDSLFNLDMNLSEGFMRCKLYRDEVLFNDYEPHQGDFIFSMSPDWILAPGDSLLETAELNICGRNVRSNDSIFFSWHQVLPQGKYRGYLYWTRTYHQNFGEGIRGILDNEIIAKSNEFSFNITEIDSSDLTILKKTKVKSYSEFVSEYPNNYFGAYALREKVRSLLGFKVDTASYIQSLVGTFEEHFSLYPNSFMNIHYLGWYIVLISSKDEKEVERNIDDLVNEHRGTLIEHYMNNEVVRKRLIAGIMSGRYVKF